MDFFPNVETLSLWLTQYGSLALFVLLCVGIVILPVPEETLMVIAGALMRHGKLNIPATAVAALLGSLSGITVSYLLGRLAGNYLIGKYGQWIGLTTARRKKVDSWFARFGKWALFVGYFIPGVRHFTGFTAGSTNLPWKKFALFAYSGALLWVSVFLSVGYFSGTYWLCLYKELEPSLDAFTIGGVVVVIGCILYLLKKFRPK